MADRKTFFRQEDMKACFRVQLTDKFLFIADNYNMSKLLCCMRLFY